MEEPVVRIERFEQLDAHPGRICYWRMRDGAWFLYLPHCGVGNLANHQVTEHEDGTISVTPSILVTGHEDGKKIQRHGYITRNVWKEC